MSLKYLNLTGLSNLVTNIKNWVTARIPTKTSEITNDSGYITSSSLPTVNNATLTIQKNGTNVQTFTANASSNVTCNITVPTKTSDLTNDSGFLTAHQSLSNYVTLNGAQTISGNKDWTGTNRFSLALYQKGFSPRASAPSSNEFGHFGIVDTDNSSVMSINYANRTTGVRDLTFRVYDSTGNVNGAGIFKDASNNYSFCSLDPNNAISLGNSDNQWNSVYANSYYLGSTAFGDIVTHNASEFLTSHQSLSNYSTKANTVKSLSISGTTITVTPGSGSAYTLTTQDTVYTHPTSAGNKHIPSGGAANQYLKYSASGTAVWADLPTIPTKTSELTNDSGFLTSHQSLSGYLPLTGGTVTGATYFTTDYYRKDTGAVRGTAPSANRWQNGVRFVDNNNVAFGGIERGYLSDRTNRVNMIVYKGTTTNTSENAQIGVGFDKNGNWFTYSPTPAANDNTTKIATTAWVQTFCDTTKGYLTSHQSLSNYVTLNGDQTISGTKTFSTDQWLLSSSNIYWRLKNTSWEAGSAAPSSTVEIGGITYRDKNNANMAYIIGFDWSSGNSGLKLLWRNKFSSGARSTSGSNVDCTLILGVTSAGVQYFEGNGRWNNNVVPLTTNSKTLGTSSLYWKGAYVITQYMGGDIVFNGTYNLRSNADNSFVRIQGGSGEGNGSRIILSGKSRSGLQGYAEIVATDGSNTNTFCLKPDGTATISTTPATSDNSTQIATTAFVKAQGYTTSAASKKLVLLAERSEAGTWTITCDTLKPIYFKFTASKNDSNAEFVVGIDGSSTCRLVNVNHGYSTNQFSYQVINTSSGGQATWGIGVPTSSTITVSVWLRNTQFQRYFNIKAYQ